jgi:hypothetical protein
LPQTPDYAMNETRPEGATNADEPLTDNANTGGPRMAVGANISPQGDSANAYLIQVWKPGDRVQTNLEHAWVYEGTERENLMGRLRFGTAIEVPDATRRAGHGTLLIRWESLTQVPLKRSDWWTHSDLIVKADCENVSALRGVRA